MSFIVNYISKYTQERVLLKILIILSTVCCVLLIPLNFLYEIHFAQFFILFAILFICSNIFIKSPRIICCCRCIGSEIIGYISYIPKPLKKHSFDLSPTISKTVAIMKNHLLLLLTQTSMFNEI